MELTLTADGLHALGKSIMEQLGAPFGSKVEIFNQEDGSLRVCAKEQEGTLSTEELVHELEKIMGHAKIVNAPIEEIQQAISDAYIERGMRGLE